MLPAVLADAIATLAGALKEDPGLEAGLVASLLPRSAAPRSTPELTPAVRAAAARLAEELPAVTQSEAGVTALSPLFADERAVPLLAFCAASTARRDVRLATLLPVAARQPELSERIVAIARDRVVSGPLLDALGCAPLLGTGVDLALPENAQARARLEILVWEAGASALEPTRGTEANFGGSTMGAAWGIPVPNANPFGSKIPSRNSLGKSAV